MRSSLAAVLALVRWPNLLLAVAAVVVGADWASRGHPGAPAVAWAATTACALGVVAYAWNALADRTIDARGHPERPIPSGAVAPQTAVWLTAAASALALVASAQISGQLVAVTTLVLALLLGYAPLKARSGGAANIVAAMLGSTPFLYGAWAAGAPERGLPLMAAAIPVHFARELAKDVVDAPTDAPDRRTLPLVVGAGPVRRIVVVTTGIALGAFTALILHRPATAWGLAPAAAACAYGAWRVARGGTDGSRWFKAGMASALAGLVAGAAGTA